jgi:hypothetical protein
MFEHRRLALFVYGFSPLFGSRFAAQIINENAFPLDAGKRKEQRDLVRIPRESETMEFEIRHESSLCNSTKHVAQYCAAVLMR